MATVPVNTNTNFGVNNFNANSVQKTSSKIPASSVFNFPATDKKTEYFIDDNSPSWFQEDVFTEILPSIANSTLDINNESITKSVIKISEPLTSFSLDEPNTSTVIAVGATAGAVSAEPLLPALARGTIAVMQAIPYAPVKMVGFIASAVAVGYFMSDSNDENENLPVLGDGKLSGVSIDQPQYDTSPSIFPSTGGSKIWGYEGSEKEIPTSWGTANDNPDVLSDLPKGYEFPDESSFNISKMYSTKGEEIDEDAPKGKYFIQKNKFNDGLINPFDKNYKGMSTLYPDKFNYKIFEKMTNNSSGTAFNGVITDIDQMYELAHRVATDKVSAFAIIDPRMDRSTVLESLTRIGDQDAGNVEFGLGRIQYLSGNQPHFLARKDDKEIYAFHSPSIFHSSAHFNELNTSEIPGFDNFRLNVKAGFASFQLEFHNHPNGDNYPSGYQRGGHFSSYEKHLLDDFPSQLANADFFSIELERFRTGLRSTMIGAIDQTSGDFSLVRHNNRGQVLSGVYNKYPASEYPLKYVRGHRDVNKAQWDLEMEKLKHLKENYFK